MSTQPFPPDLPLSDCLEAARLRIQVSPEELTEARTRRDAIGAALREEFPGSETYASGSVAHGDALTPLTDIDLGVVVVGVDAQYGPGKHGPAYLQERAAAAIKRRLGPAYDDLRVEFRGQKRAILVRFRDPVTPGQPDFTADVIIALDNPYGQGLFIPRYDSWDRSDPQGHTRLVHEANSASQVAYARVVRLVKHWNRRHDRPLCSWNIKALALGCITEPMPLLDGLRRWFQHAAEQVVAGDTPDPAGVSAPIKLNKDRREVVRLLRGAAEAVERAQAFEAAGYRCLAQDEMARLFNDEEMFPAPNPERVRADSADRQRRRQGSDSLAAAWGVEVARSRPAVRAWGIS